jgi:hypothetical protein
VELKHPPRTPGSGAPTGAYRLDPHTGTWWWSESVFAIHGFTAREVVPTTELLLAHAHPDDRADLAALLSDPPPTLSAAYRITDAEHRERLCVLVGERREDGVHGYLIDLTDLVDRRGQAVATSAIAAAATSRSVIEQAVGAVAFSQQLDPPAAFALLRAASMDANVPIRSLATAIVDALPELGADAERVRRFLAELRRPGHRTTAD